MTQKIESMLREITRHAHNGAQTKPACAHCSGVEILAHLALEALASHAPSDKNAEGLIWAVERWNLEVRHRPIVNIHRRTLDETWRQVIRYFGGDPNVLLDAPSEAAAQPDGCHCDFCCKLRADWMEKYAEIEHNDH